MPQESKKKEKTKPLMTQKISKEERWLLSCITKDKNYWDNLQKFVSKYAIDLEEYSCLYHVANLYLAQGYKSADLILGECGEYESVLSSCLVEKVGEVDFDEIFQDCLRYLLGKSLDSEEKKLMIKFRRIEEKEEERLKIRGKMNTIYKLRCMIKQKEVLI